jgi:hypothetical protein
MYIYRFLRLLFGLSAVGEQLYAVLLHARSTSHVPYHSQPACFSLISPCKSILTKNTIQVVLFYCHRRTGIMFGIKPRDRMSEGQTTLL